MKKYCSYSYISVDGSIRHIKTGENGVTEEHIKFLIESDSDEKYKERYRNEEKEVSYDEYFENVLSVKDEKAEDEKDPEQIRMEELLRQCVDRLSPEHQELFYKRMGLQMALELIGKEKGVSRQAVSAQFARMRKNLKNMLETLK